MAKESFDVVISTELLEHVRNWKKVVSNIKNICKPNGIILITTRSYGHGYHTYPTDFWRYEFLDLKYIFSDCLIEILEKDYATPRMFMKAKKPEYFIENDLSNYLLYSIIDDRRVKYIEEKRLKDFLRKYEIKETVKRYLKKVFRLLFH